MESVAVVEEEVEEHPIHFNFLIYKGGEYGIKMYLSYQEGAQSKASVLQTGTVPGDIK